MNLLIVYLCCFKIRLTFLF